MTHPQSTTRPRAAASRPALWAASALAPTIGLALAAAPVRAKDELPARQPGLWATQMQMAGMPAGMGNSQHCVDAATDAAMQNQALAGDGEMRCVHKVSQRSAGLVVMQADCSGAEGKAHMTARISGDMQRSYQVDNHVTFTPPRNGMREANMVIQARHMGACPAGMKPGEVRMAGMSGLGVNPQAGTMDLSALENMSPEQLKRLAEQMKQMQPGGKP